MAFFEDLTGQKFGRLRVVIENPVRWPRVYFICVCDCGVYRTVAASKLKNGESQSCGCLGIEKTKASNSTHGMSKTPAFSSWSSMMYRCYDERGMSYHRYGGRGIKVCDKWHTFEGFYSDMGPCKKGMSIERLDVDKGYDPSNCIWLDIKLQGRNTSKSIVKGTTLREMAAKAGKHVWSVEYLHYRRKIPLSEALEKARPIDEKIRNSQGWHYSLDGKR